MKKVKNVLILALAVVSIASLASCGGTSQTTSVAGNTTSAASVVSNVTTSETPVSTVADASVLAAVKDAEGLSQDALFAKAAEEIQDGTLKFIGTSSRFKGAIDSFKAELAKKNAKCANMTITTDTAVDGVIYTKLLGEIEAHESDGYDAALVQDGYQLQKKGIETGYFVNYIPKEWKDATDTDAASDSDPFALQYNFKTWMINNADGNTDKIDNVWDITGSKFNGKLVTMNPTNENVNMDWLIMLTQDKWCDVLKSAFEDASNDNASLDLTPYAKYGDKMKYAFAFINGYLTNATFYADDGKARDAFDTKTAAGQAAWIVYSKIASIGETDTVSKKNLTICALGNQNTDGNAATMQMKGFGGFMYKHYLQIMPYTKHPYTSAAFINYLSTTAAGYNKWGEDIGDYPTMPSINPDRTKFGHGTLDTTLTSGVYKFTQSNTGDNVFPALNDPKSSWWNSATGGNVVVENPSYIATKYNMVMSFITTVIAKKGS
jgi:hypothetical protein